MHKTYILQNIKITRSKNESCLNTTTTDKLTFKEKSPLTSPLVEVKDLITTKSTINAKILGIQQAFRTLGCVSCHKKVLYVPDVDSVVG